jgi:hypothetical protein
MAGPLVVAYGTAELPELCRQSVDYAQAWVERGLLESLADPDGAHAGAGGDGGNVSSDNPSSRKLF